MNRTLNAIAVPVGLVACMVGASLDQPLVGPLIVAVLLVVQSFSMIDPRRTIGLIAVVGVLGTAIDSTLIAAQVYWVREPLRGLWICPLWITAMWINLGTALHGCLAGCAWRLSRIALVGAVMAPAVYSVADASGAIRVVAPPQWALPAFAVVGATAVPALFWLSRSPFYRPRREESEPESG